MMRKRKIWAENMISQPIFRLYQQIKDFTQIGLQTLLAASFSFIERSCSTTAVAFSRAAFLLSWAWIALSILATSFPWSEA